jgi:hypothetical protein
MPTHELVLRVDAPGADPAAQVHSAHSAAVRKRVYGDLKHKVFSVSWITLRLGTPKAEQAFEVLQRERRAGTAVVGTAHFSERLTEEDEPQSDWCLLHTPQVSGSFSLWDDYPQYKPGSLPPNAHALNHAFVSERFVSVCERAGLRGIEFLRCRNSGRKASAPWFAALPARSLGNGLDHPWLDRERWVRHVAGDSWKRIGSIETGQSQFHQFWLRRETTATEPLVRRLLALCPMPSDPPAGQLGLMFVMAPRFLARVEPDDDFAYVPWGEDGPNREGKIMRFRMLALRRRARDALVDAKLFKPRDFQRVRSIAEPEPGVLDLDARYPALGPMYSAEELDAMKA